MSHLLFEEANQDIEEVYLTLTATEQEQFREYLDSLTETEINDYFSTLRLEDDVATAIKNTLETPLQTTPVRSPVTPYFLQAQVPDYVVQGQIGEEVVSDETTWRSIWNAQASV